MILLVLLPGVNTQVLGQSETHRFAANLTVSRELQESCNPEGRLFVFICQNPNVEPRRLTWPSPTRPCHIFARNIADLDVSKGCRIDPSADWTSTTGWTMEEIPEGEYYVQVLWDQDQNESGINAPGNLYSEKQKVQLDKSVQLDISLDQVIGPVKLADHPLVRLVEITSDTLSAWWGKPMQLKASVLLPPDYDANAHNAYPIRYNVAGYGGRYTRINRLVSSNDFMDWWDSEEAPRVINVFLDGEGPFGDSYQMDSENSGPYGYALIHELIPFIESKYRGTTTPETRFVDGCSTGGWVSLGLQLYYPDLFNGVFSYSPDAIEFENYQLINIYRDENAFFNEYGYLRPIMRDVKGEPMLSIRDFIQYENVLGASDTYLNSGGQLSAHTALYSPKGENGLPRPLIDPVTGGIDPEVAAHWKKYDFKIYARDHWDELGPKLQGKIFIWMGDMDNFYLNTATRAFDDFLKNTKNPVSDATVIFSPMEGHCSQYSHREVLMKIQERLTILNP